MVYVRQTIVQDASSALSRAVCIATRYSAVRRQFGSQNGGPETQVIDKSIFVFVDGSRCMFLFKKSTIY